MGGKGVHTVLDVCGGDLAGEESLEALLGQLDPPGWEQECLASMWGAEATIQVRGEASRGAGGTGDRTSRRQIPQDLQTDQVGSWGESTFSCTENQPGHALGGAEANVTQTITGVPKAGTGTPESPAFWVKELRPGLDDMHGASGHSCKPRPAGSRVRACN